MRRGTRGQIPHCKHGGDGFTHSRHSIEHAGKRESVAHEGHGQPHLMAKGGGIHIKKSHEGLLHKDLGVAQGKPIPAAKMEKAKAHASPAEKKRIVFAENAKHWHHGK